MDSFGGRHEVFVTIRVLERPPEPPGQPRTEGEVVMASERQTVAQGDTAVLRCSVVGGETGAAAFTWTKVGDDDGDFLEDPDNSASVSGALTLRRVDIDDRGVYVCTLDGSGGYLRSNSD